MKVFLTGATGYIGSAVAEKLTGAGHTVLGLARTAEAEQKLTERGIEILVGDFSDPASLARAVADADAVISTATTNNGQADSSAVSTMLDALEGTHKKFIYTSGCWVVGDTGETEVPEDAPYNPPALVAWRPAVEQLVLNATGRGVQGIVIRPGIVYGMGTGIPAMLLQPVKQEGVVRFIGEGQNYWPVVHVDDLADLYVLALEKAPAGSLFNAVSESVRLRDIAEAAARGAGVPGKLQSWPLDLARQALGPFADALALSERMLPAKAERELGWQPKAPSITEDMERGSYTK